MKFIILIIAAYLLGSLPFGLIIAAAHGKDLRRIGSGNIGATNLARALGRNWGLFCFALDFLKGLAPMITAKLFIPSQPTTTQLSLWLAAGCAAILGHILPIYVKFKGGKGVATSLGVVIGLWPYYTLPGIVVFSIWCIFVLIWRYISLASITAAAFFPIALAAAIAITPAWHFHRLWPLLIIAVAVPAIVVLTHRQNIKRLLAGTENKVLTKKN